MKISLQDAKGLLKPGMTANAEISIETKSTVAVPKAAITRRDGRDVVFVVKDGKAVQTPVELGFSGDDYVIINQGVTAGEEIVVADPDAVINGLAIGINNQEFRSSGIQELRSQEV